MKANEFSKTEIADMIMGIIAPDPDEKHKKVIEKTRRQLMSFNNFDMKKGFEKITGMELVLTSSDSFVILRKDDDFLNNVKINGLRPYCD